MGRKSKGCKMAKVILKERKSCQPKIVARYNEYVITQGVTNGMFYVFSKDIFVGLHAVFANAVSLISLREGQRFDINNIKDLRNG